MKNRKLNELMRNEVDILKMCQSLNIIKMLDFFEKEKEGLLFIVLEYCNGGNLKDYVLQQKDGKLTEKESLSILQQII
jgi:serine/threonine protein kinase